MEAVRQAFLKQLPQSSEATAILNADQSPSEVSRDMLESVNRLLKQS